MSDVIEETVVDELYAGCVTTTPRPYDWGEWSGSGSQPYEVILPGDLRCNECRIFFEDGDVIDIEDGRDEPAEEVTAHEGIDCPEFDCDQGVLERFDGEGYTPVMQFQYPLPDGLRWGERFTAQQLENASTAMILVKMEDDDSYVLALAGGGMDFSWDICQAYMACGFLPPTHFADLPAFAGMDFKAPRQAKTIEAVLKSLRLHEQWLQRKAASLVRLSEEGR